MKRKYTVPQGRRKKTEVENNKHELPSKQRVGSEKEKCKKEEHKKSQKEREFALEAVQ